MLHNEALPGSSLVKRCSLKGEKHVMAGLTTLDCGHCFHDECILAKLNESLSCPLCVKHKSPPQSGVAAA
jgi:ribosomal protein S27E